MSNEGRAERALARVGRAIDRRNARDPRPVLRTPEQRRFTKRVGTWILTLAVLLGLVVPVIAALPSNARDALSVTGAFALLGATLVAVNHARRSADAAASQVFEQARREERQAARDAAENLDTIHNSLTPLESLVSQLLTDSLQRESADVVVQLSTSLFDGLSDKIRAARRAGSALPLEYSTRLDALVVLAEELATPIAEVTAAARLVLEGARGILGTTPQEIKDQVAAFPSVETDPGVDFARMTARPWSSAAKDAEPLIKAFRALAARRGPTPDS